MARCCGGTGCMCRLEAGPGTTVAGSGSASDPFVITASPHFTVDQCSTFIRTTLSGTGSDTHPWSLCVDVDQNATLDMIPDVAADSSTQNGWVLAWDANLNVWHPQPPATAEPGGITHDTSLAGDGSVGFPLEVNEDPLGLLTTRLDGLGLTDEAQQQLVRTFDNPSDRASMIPPPALNSLSMLATNPGEVDYWDGLSWNIIHGDHALDMHSGEFMQLSGPWTGGRMTMVGKQINEVSDTNGVITLLDSTDLQGFSGVLQIQFQETATSAVTALPWKAIAYPDATQVSAVCYRLLDGSTWGGQQFVGSVLAWCY